MPVRTSIPFKDGVFFITFTCIKWIKLFEICNGHDLVYKWFQFLISQGHHIIGYVIMPNHVHALIAFKHSQKSINVIVGNGKRFIAYEVVKRLKLSEHYVLLEAMEHWVDHSDKKKNKLHQVFEASFDWKECNSEDFIQQKLDYIHNNPCRNKDLMIQNPQDYEHSSARYYREQVEGPVKITTILELEDIKLN